MDDGSEGKVGSVVWRATDPEEINLTEVPEEYKSLMRRMAKLGQERLKQIRKEIEDGRATEVSE